MKKYVKSFRELKVGDIVKSTCYQKHKYKILKTPTKNKQLVYDLKNNVKHEAMMQLGNSNKWLWYFVEQSKKKFNNKINFLFLNNK